MRHGHIKLSRKMFDGNDEFWSEPRVYSRAEAWIDLLQLAAWREGTRYSTAKHGTDVLARGEFVASLRFLGERWQWGKWKVQHFLEGLEETGRLAGHRTGQHGTVYLIANYDVYQGAPAPDRTAEPAEDRTGTGQGPDKEEAVKQFNSSSDQPRASDATTTAEGWEARFPEPAHRDVVRRFLDGLPADRPRTQWVAMIEGWLDGMGLPGMRPATPAAVAAALLEYGAAGAGDYSPRHLAGYVARAMHERPSAVRTAGAGNGARPAAAGLPSGLPASAVAQTLLDALDGAGLTHNGVPREEYQRRVRDLAPQVGYDAEEFVALVKATKPWDLERFTFAPERRLEFERRFKRAQSGVGVAA